MMCDLGFRIGLINLQFMILDFRFMIYDWIG